MKERPLLMVILGLDGREISVDQLQVGENLAGQIMQLYPAGFPDQTVYVYRDCILDDNLIPQDDVPTITIKKQDFFILRATPAKQAIVPILTAVALASVTYFTGGTLTAALLIGGTALATGLAVSLIPPPRVPSSETSRDQASGLNTLGTPRNVARLQSRVPEIFGQMRIWPDLAIPPLEEWSGRFQRVSCLYCIGVGTYQISTPRLGETSISGLAGVTVTQYGPGSLMPILPVGRQSESQQQIDLDAPTVDGGDFTAWVTAVGDNLAEIWLEFGFPSGLVVYKSSGGTRSEHTAIRVEYQRIDIPNLFVFHQDHEFSSATGNPCRYTIKIPVDNPGQYRVRARRLDDGTHGDDDVHVSNMVLVKVVGIEYLPLSSRQTHQKTFVFLTIDNNDQVAQLSSITFNLICVRMLRLLNSDGTMTGDLYATRFFRDALMYVLTDPALGDFALTHIDTDSIYGIHGRTTIIDDTVGAQFNGVFDRWMSVDEMAQGIAQVVRSAVVFDGGRLVLMRDEDKEAPISIFNRRVRPADDQSTRVMQFLTPDEEDGVSIDWIDSDNGYTPRTYIYPETALNPRTVNLIGVTHWSQVYRRAVYEMDRQRYRRRTYKAQVTEEGLICNPFDVVTIIDPWLDPLTDGDIVGYNAAKRTVTIDQPMTPAFGRVMRIRNIEGTLTEDVAIVNSADASTEIALLQVPSFPIVPRNPTHQVGNLFVMGTISYLDEHNWHVVDVTVLDNNIVELNLIEYSSNVFNCDRLTVPDAPAFQ